MNILSFAVLAALLQGVTSSPGSVEGLVVTAGTGQPVAGAEVALGPLVVPGVSAASKMVVPQEAVQTDGNGRFIFLNVPSGEYIIGVKTVGGKRLSMRRVAVTVGEGQQLRGVRVETLAGVIEGRILNRNGKPAKGVTVIALQPSFYEGSPVVNASFSGSGDFGGRAQTVTGSDGTYRIESLYPGIYYVGVGFTHPHPRFLPATCLPPDNIGAELPPAPNPLADMLIRNIRRRQTLTIPDVVYFPGTSTASAAQTIQVFEQAPARADFQLTSSAKPLRLKGEVVDGAGDPSKAPASRSCPPQVFSMTAATGWAGSATLLRATAHSK